MRIAIAVTLAFFAVVSGMGAYRDFLRVMRGPRPARYFGAIIAVVVTLWSLYAACWIATH